MSTTSPPPMDGCTDLFIPLLQKEPNKERAFNEEEEGKEREEIIY